MTPQARPEPDLSLDALRAAYAAGAATPAEVVAAAASRARADAHHAWIHVLGDDELGLHLAALERALPEALPLYGVPFAIKDNIDLAGVPTTVACPAVSYTPERSATVVQRLLAAGAVPIGKTNLDQFATGLVGTRSPYGAVHNACDARYVAGGSSAGSAVALALGQVAFALGTDTAGSGRVPAAFNNVLGHKPTRGWLSTRGVVPACRSLDCVSVFARSAPEAAEVLDVAGGYDADDPFARALPAAPAPPRRGERFAFAVARPGELAFDDVDYEKRYADACDQLSELGGTPVPVDVSPLLEAAALLYEGPWLAERRLAVDALLQGREDALHPVTRAVLRGGAPQSAQDCFRAQQRLAELSLAARALLAEVELLALPTTPGIFTRDQVEENPLATNARLGRFTNFANLLDLCACAVPAGFRPDGMPFGVTLFAPAGHDARLLARAAQLQPRCVRHAGAGLALPDLRAPRLVGGAWTDLVVCGAHMSGQPLEGELRALGGVLVRGAHTAPGYRLYALPGGPPERPALVRGSGGASIEIEIWRLPTAAIGALLAKVAAPLGLGRVDVEDGQRLTGFVCAADGWRGGHDITRYGGWRAWLRARAEGEAP